MGRESAAKLKKKPRLLDNSGCRPARSNDVGWVENVLGWGASLPGKLLADGGHDRIHHWLLKVRVGHTLDDVGGAALTAKPAPQVAEHVRAGQGESDCPQDQPLEPETEQGRQE